MGKVRIVSHRGGGLYRAIPVYDFTTLDKEVVDLNKQETAFAPLIQKTLLTMAALENDLAVAEDALNAVLRQWKDGLIRNLNDAPPIPTPASNDPITGLPWDDPADGLEADLLAAINAARSAASVGTVARNDDLDRAALNYLREQADTGRSGHIGIGNTSPGDRVMLVGYAPLAVGEALAYGSSSAAAVITSWQRSSASTLLDAEYVDVGIGYVHEATYPMTHLWCAVFAKPGGSTLGTFSFESPAAETAEGQQAALNKIELPQTQTHQPKKLSEAAAIYARAAQKHAAALTDLARLYAEHMTRLRRLAELATLKTTLNATEIDVWCADYTETLTPGQEYGSFEPPGFYLEEATAMIVTIYAGTPAERAVAYWERSINIAPRGTRFGPWGKLRLGTNMSASSVFVALALEPGHLRWKPWCRYGIVTRADAATCDVQLNGVNERDPEAEARLLALGGSQKPLGLNQPATLLTNVPADYMNVGAQLFEAGDEVLVYFKNFDWAQPYVIGFRRLPRKMSRRTNWAQIS